MENLNQHPINPIDEQDKSIEKKKESKISLNENKYVKEPNTLVPFENCIRVQNNYFLEHENEITPINKDVIITDYGRDAVKKVRKYLKFINHPEHINYQKQVGINYNLYRPLSYIPKKGSFFNIEKMLKHIFRGEHYEMILTYFWVLYIKPQHPLPFIGLVSKTKGTGKTKFLQFVKAIFEANAKFIDAEDITANFNSSYIDKLCILIDEKMDGKHRKSDLQKYKKLVTGGVQTRKEKYQTDIDVEFYGKFIMCSNDEQTMIALEEENTRFWIIDVPKLEDVDIDIIKNAIAEIPAFLHYLQHDFKPMKRESRLWFNPESIQTERSRILQENSRSEIAKEVIERLTDYFTKHSDIKVITFSANHFLETFPNNITISYLGRVLKSEFNKESCIKEIENPFSDYNHETTRCRCYTFTRDEIISN